MSRVEKPFLKSIVRSAVGKPLILLAEKFPELRPMLRNLGMRLTEPLFGNRVVSVPWGARQNLKLTHLSSNYLSFQLFWRGIGHYEPITALVLSSLLKPGSTFMDVGANVGFFSLVMSRSVADLQIIAFEPNPKNFEILRANVSANGLKKVICEPMAISDAQGKSKLFFNDSDMSASLVPDFQRESNSREDWVEVDTASLDGYLERHPGRKPSVIKVDVEGHEEAFFKGARQTLATHKPDIIMEVLGNHSPSLVSQLRENGYGFYPITNKGFVQSEGLERIPAMPFHFLNYLMSARPAFEIELLFRRIQRDVDAIDLYQTCKYLGSGAVFAWAAKWQVEMMEFSIPIPIQTAC